ncbi:MAG: cobyrinic acid a,c-diamide synthase [Syntrophaceae bacterium CG2_30_49_12]|nr:MAG: cobyrinic acid a,c-diamide synthase [Syntrophaceae bacterium CG2_30_49_12]PIP08390.1 MAG: cobyrinic acid a,c-diamide synthase [Syntrophobacterales bacterium CG23_combo_of_CG06-09_8_20_14_all_48_27]PJA49166.1 MAG: cobyrinic acid a,c-diamide synthase [Syntrophobacterales bacterium CG_4_9_14_3_um_filter_49_8]PJC74881.1 MAG: cobyrinic acid a,c-diamide synthase [Syntrophobacterales bacterium CG_4_8_14_3_um_filter_49_14]
MVIVCPRVVFSALRGNSGKTFLTVGVGACLRNRGKRIVPFKKGPDYIDAAWLGMATGRPCHNLDVFLMEREGVFSSFLARLPQTDGVLVEGNRGLFDGMNREGSYSTAELAKMLQMPVILIVDCSMTTRTAAAMLLGCQHFDPEVAIKGVILNRIGGTRHETIVRSAIEDSCGVPVLGAVPRITGGAFPGRHMGLVPPPEHLGASLAVAEAARIAARYIDIDRLWEVAEGSPPLTLPDLKGEEAAWPACTSRQPRIGFIRDSAFWFYYPDNLEALERLGASLVECSALDDEELPPIDALYIGGGFPETHAESLAANVSFRRSLHEAVERGLPVYAECGGLMYLGEKLIVKERTFPMVGVFPLNFVLDRRPQGHGYTILEVDVPNPYFPTGEILHGHEFHYSHILDGEEGSLTLALNVRRGYGINGRKDGLCYKNVLATYSHLHASGAKRWASALFEQALFYKDREDKLFWEGRPIVVNDVQVVTGNSGRPDACFRQTL